MKIFLEDEEKLSRIFINFFYEKIDLNNWTLYFFITIMMFLRLLIRAYKLLKKK